MLANVDHKSFIVEAFVVAFELLLDYHLVKRVEGDKWRDKDRGGSEKERKKENRKREGERKTEREGDKEEGTKRKDV